MELAGPTSTVVDTQVSDSIGKRGRFTKELAMMWTARLAKWLVVGTAVTASAAAGAGCLTRPVGQQPPTTKDNFITTVSQAQVDKVDLLFMIDNSSSMGDKQAILADAVPNLITGLLKPQCVDQNGKP